MQSPSPLYAIILLQLFACGGSETTVPSTPDAQVQADVMRESDQGGSETTTDADAVGEQDTRAQPAPTLPCPHGQAQVDDGTCIPMGIQGCAEMFINPATGLCEPGPDDCPAGHVAVFEEGCKSVNIPGCVEEFINPTTGLCDPLPEDCPPGHMPVADEGCVRVGVVDCHADFVDPITGHCEADPKLCGAHQIPVPTQGCVSLDPPAGCGEGTFGDIAPLSGDVHVDPSASSTGANGSPQAPYPTLAQALSAVSPGGRLVLAAGTYPERLLIDASISVIGRCSSMVTLTGPPGSPSQNYAAIEVYGPYEVSVANLRLSPVDMGVLVGGGAQVTMAHTAIVGAYHKGVMVMDAASSLTMSTVLISDTEGDLWGFSGYGIEVLFGAQLTIEQSAIIGNTSQGVTVSDVGSRATLRDVSILSTLPEIDGWSGRGASVNFGATMTLEESVLRNNHGAGLSILGSGASADAQEIYIAGTKYASLDYYYGVGIELSDEAALTLDTGVISDNQGGGLLMFAGSSASLDTALVAANKPAASGSLGAGLQLQGGSTLTLHRGVLVDNHTAGISVGQTGSHASINRALIARSKSGATGDDGVGVWGDLGGSLDLDTVIISDNQGAGIALGWSNQEATLQHVIVQRTALSAAGNGMGLFLAPGATARLESGALWGNQNAGVYLSGAGTQLALNRVLVAQTEHDANGENGIGIGLTSAAALLAEDVTIRDSYYAGIFAVGEEISLTLEGLLVARSRPSETIKPGGVGLLMGLGVTATITQSAFVDHVEAGVDVVQSQVNLSQSFVSDISAGDDGLYGDGVIANEEAVATLDAVVSVNNARAGFTFNKSAGSLDRCASSGNTIGLVTQGDHATEPLSVGDDNIITGNGQDLMSDEGLSVPSLAMETPGL